MKHITIVELNINNQKCFGIKSSRKSKGKHSLGKFFFTAYSTREKALEVSNRIESSYKPTNETIDLV